MKISYNHLINCIPQRPSILELSDKLFQLGHEHEVNNNIFDFEFTPNRGDCLSVRGLLRDLKIFYDLNLDQPIYEKEIKESKFNFFNNAVNHCRNISFMKLEIFETTNNYNGKFKDYFCDLDIKKINFFTDVSNFVSYETGQPTHCYDSSILKIPLSLDYLKENYKFDTLLDKSIEIEKGNLVFFDKDNKVINFAGIVGGISTACKINTKSVIVECAHFDPEIILGKSLRYGITSDAAHKFERYTDPNCHEYVLRRFIKIVEDHAEIKSLEIFSENYSNDELTSINYDFYKINKILGTNITEKECLNYLNRLGFLIQEDQILIPSHRNDIISMNDIAEEIARSVGYNNLGTKEFNISIDNKSNKDLEEKKLKKLLVDSGFFEVINDPFSLISSDSTITIDNPLDSNRKFLRTDLKDSLLQNLSYNERRQKDSIKLFEISNVYSKDSSVRVVGIVASGRLDKNYEDFSKKIESKHIKELLQKYTNIENIKFETISRDSLNSKSKYPIIYLEFSFDSSLEVDYEHIDFNLDDINNKKYLKISEYPSSTRDLSFSIKDFSKSQALQELIHGFQNDLLKEVFIFDYFENENGKEIKIGFRFIFQSKDSNLTDEIVNDAMNLIIKKALKINTVTIPGL